MLSIGEKRTPRQSGAMVAAAFGPAFYPAEAPFSPSEWYPEYPFGGPPERSERNPAYATVRESLRLLGLDADRFGTSRWNPLGGVVRAGDTVVLKPNFVRDFRETLPGDGACLVTHGSVIRAVLDYVFMALEGHGRIIIADAPQNDADFDAIRRIVGLDEIREFYRRHVGFDIEVYDLRPERTYKLDGVIVGHRPLAGDPAGYVKVSLDRLSTFAEINQQCHRLYGAEYDASELRRHHHDDVHEHLISRTVLSADCVISIPKLKTHKKVGLTACMKNMVGINGNKNWLPHHREGTPAQGGDQFADDGLRRRIERSTVAAFKRVFPWLGPLRPLVARPLKAGGRRVFGDTNKDTIRSGNWYGNDTTWRMVVDLNRILSYADATGRLQNRRPRRLFSVVDGIVGGEGNGPLDAVPKPAGLVLAGLSPVAIDLVAARLMGFNGGRMPVLARAFDPHKLPLVDFAFEDLAVVSNQAGCEGRLSTLTTPGLGFLPHFGWRGYVELCPTTCCCLSHA